MDSIGSSSLITGGVDTHKDTHTVAALDATGRLLGNQAFAASGSGYTALITWLRDFGPIDRIGVEGTGSYGSGLAGYLREQGVHVVEVNRPNRQVRRRHGKSDPAEGVILNPRFNRLYQVSVATTPDSHTSIKFTSPKGTSSASPRWA